MVKPTSLIRFIEIFKWPEQLCRIFLFHLQDVGDFAGKFNDIKRLLYEFFSAGFQELVDLILFYDAAHDNNFNVFEFGISSYRLADDVAVDIGQHIIK